MTYAMYPHCNTEVLHAPGACRFCDKYPERQAARAASGGGFTPDEANGWEGNRAQPAMEPLPFRSPSRTRLNRRNLSGAFVHDFWS